MIRHRKGLLINILLFIVLISVGCGETKGVSILEEENLQTAEENQKDNSKEEKESSKTEYNKLTTIKDIEGYWYGEIGYVSIHLFEGKTGEINFFDNHGGSYLIFKNYQNEENAIKFEFNPSEFGYENHSMFSISIKKTGDKSIEIAMDSVAHSFNKVSADEYFADTNQEEYNGDKDIEATETQVNFLQKELKDLSDQNIEIGTLMNNFDYTNSVYTYLTYIGDDDSADNIRTAILNKIKEMNKIADKYIWLDIFSVNAYLKNEVPETEEEKQINGLTDSRVENDENRAFFVSTNPEDRWILEKKAVSNNDLAGYVLTFSSNAQFYKERDEQLNRRSRYPLYDIENLNGLTVLKEAFTKGISTDVQDEFDKNEKILESTILKEILGFWHYREMGQYYEITFDESGGMISQSPLGTGYSFNVIREEENTIEIALAIGGTWIIERVDDRLNVVKSDGYDMVLHLSSKEDIENK